jgi:hypothetical protein
MLATFLVESAASTLTEQRCQTTSVMALNGFEDYQAMNKRQSEAIGHGIGGAAEMIWVMVGGGCCCLSRPL